MFSYHARGEKRSQGIWPLLVGGFLLECVRVFYYLRSAKSIARWEPVSRKSAFGIAHRTKTIDKMQAYSKILVRKNR